MRKLFSRLALLVSAAIIVGGSAFAQIQSQAFPQKWFYASDYGTWQIRGQSANTYTFSPIALCQVASPGGGTFIPFSTNAGIYIQDATPANSEVVTPSAVTITSSSCSITVAPANQHYSFNLLSATGGLQEVLNQISASNAYPAVVWLDRNWYQAVNTVPGTNPATVIANAKGNPAVRLVDNTTTPFQYWAWNGTAYAAIGTLTGGSSAPTAAAGAAAGTSPTGPTNTDVSGGNAFTVALTTGTATTTGTLFTETWATSGAFTYEPSCLVTSTGSNALSGFTVTPSYTSSAAKITIAVTTAPTASTAYAFSVNCH